MKNKLNLLFYPFFQVTLFYLAAFYILEEKLMFASFFIFLASLFLSFSLHISYHYHVHHKPKSKTIDALINYSISLFLGLPFQFYQLQHFVHHRYDNGLKDFTSTYKLEHGKQVAKSVWKYSLLWFLQIKERKKFIKQTTELGYMNPCVRRKMRLEGLLNLVFISLMAWYQIQIAAGYLVMIYLGWVFIALHNYGQHLPEGLQDKKGYSYYGKIYNKLFLNNGLHFEHHDQPGIKYWNLQENRETAGVNKHLHLIDPFFYKNQEIQP